MSRKLVPLQTALHRVKSQGTPDQDAFETVRQRIAAGEVGCFCNALRAFTLFATSAFTAELEGSGCQYIATSGDLDPIDSALLLSLVEGQRQSVWIKGRAYTLSRQDDRFEVWFEGSEITTGAAKSLLPSIWRFAVPTREENSIVSDDLSSRLRTYASQVSVSLHDVHRLWPTADEKPPIKLGRKPKHDRASIQAEAGSWLDRNLSHEMTLSRLVEHIKDIAESKWGEVPSDSWLKATLGPLFKKHRAK